MSCRPGTPRRSSTGGCQNTVAITVRPAGRSRTCYARHSTPVLRRGRDDGRVARTAARSAAPRRRPGPARLGAEARAVRSSGPGAPLREESALPASRAADHDAFDLVDGHRVRGSVVELCGLERRRVVCGRGRDPTLSPIRVTVFRFRRRGPSGPAPATGPAARRTGRASPAGCRAPGTARTPTCRGCAIAA